MSGHAVEPMPSVHRGGMDHPLSATIRRIAPNLTMQGLLLTSLLLGLDPLWLLLGHEERALSCNVGRGCAVELSISWYKGMWNRVIEEVGADFLKDCHGLHEADIAEYVAGKNILVSDFLEFVETEVDLEDLFRYPERDIRKAG